MKVYKIETDVNRYRSLLPADDGVFNTNILRFDCAPKAAAWDAPEMYCQEPLLPAADFWSISNDATIGVTHVALPKVRTCFEMAGELLPMTFEEFHLTLLNVTKCINCLQHDRCKWTMTKDGRRIYPDPFTPGSYVFDSTRFAESSIFKLPELPRGGLFCAEWDGDPDSEFRAAVETNGLTGLVFELLWEG